MAEPLTLMTMSRSQPSGSRRVSVVSTARRAAAPKPPASAIIRTAITVGPGGLSPMAIPSQMAVPPSRSVPTP